jgi:Holliday junction DNA helicase RuvB
VLTLKAFRHLGLSGPARAATPELPMFEEGED